MKLINILVGAFYIMFGIYLWGNPAETILAYSIYFGIVHIAGAIAALVFHLVKKIKPVPYGSISVSFLMGLAIFCLPMFSLSVLLWLFIFSFLSLAIFSVYAATKNKGQKWYYVHVGIAVLAVIYGFVMMFNPIAGFVTLAKILAAGIIFNGVTYLFVTPQQ